MASKMRGEAKRRAARAGSGSKKIAVVTGGAKRLGRAIVETLAAEGFSVAIIYNGSRDAAIELKRMLEANGSTAFIFKADIARSNDVRKMVDAVVGEFGRVDLLVNNAGLFFDSPFLTATEKDWDTLLGVNVKGMFLVSQLMSRVMLKHDGGRIINIASVGGLQAWSGYTPYSVSKAGAIMLTRCMAKALAPKIMVNAIAPGTIQMEGDNTANFIPRERIPLKRYGGPSDITSLVVYLATTAAYITGQIIPVDGGRTLS